MFSVLDNCDFSSFFGSINNVISVYMSLVPVNDIVISADVSAAYDKSKFVINPVNVYLFIDRIRFCKSSIFHDGYNSCNFDLSGIINLLNNAFVGG